jgi:16S rRNA (uracil1498-N3)-methyltransferase
MQCRRSRLPTVEPLGRLGDLIDHPALLIGDVAAEPFLSVASRLGAPTGNEWCVVIGPEGGFDPEERAALTAASDYPPCSVGSYVLRAETAALSLAAVMSAWRACPLSQ